MRRALLSISLVAIGACADFRDVFMPYQPRPAELAEVQRHPRPAPVMDVAVVLGCPAAPDGTPSSCQRCRVKTAVREYRRGGVRHLLFSGNAAHSPHVEADVMAELAVKRGVPEAHVLREPRALTTWQNVRFAKELIDRRGLHTVLFISTLDHLPRARRIARFYGIDDARAGYVACDTDLPPDSEAEWQRPPDLGAPTAPEPDAGAPAEAEPDLSQPDGGAE
jgi:uncharacterized SAM-binding protein YcdF (DUF218 family)